MFDSMRGLTVTADNTLAANSASAEGTGTDWLTPSATGFATVGSSFYASATYIYIAIRRGPMRTPTSGTSVFAPFTYTGDGASTRTFNIGLNPVDMVWQACRSSSTYSFNTLSSRLQGGNGMSTASTGSEVATQQAYDVQTGIRAIAFENTLNQSGQTFVMEGFRRAPGFFDEVCYTGTGTQRTVNHNLGVAPELIIAKVRDLAGEQWAVQATPALAADKVGFLNSTNAFGSFSQFGSTAPTSTVFTANSAINEAGYNNVAYLFASCPGVSKVGSYTGNGSSQTINCGFASGARFVLIKRTDSTGDWYVWDSARGITSGNDPYLLLNSTAAEVTSTNYVDAAASGFTITSSAPAAINASGGSYIYLAIS